jgi:hypothetical protein
LLSFINARSCINPTLAKPAFGQSMHRNRRATDQIRCALFAW